MLTVPFTEPIIPLDHISVRVVHFSLLLYSYQVKNSRKIGDKRFVYETSQETNVCGHYKREW